MGSKKTTPEKPPAYAFCESVAAGSQSRWHIRPLTKVGPKLGGGIDMPSLCGHVKPPQGWDLTVPVEEHHLSHACPECVVKYQERKEG
ncbi:hypothetical protein KJ909_03960 [Patescibacteria group bacterium]|nr:hypothetical protein [Patescibacteria group bacterium]